MNDAAVTFDRTDLQGNILTGYRRNVVRHLVCRIPDRTAARRFLGVAASGGSDHVPAITPEPASITRGLPKSDYWFNISLTWQGLKALGLTWHDLASFPTEFIQGMPARAMKLGDFGDSAPEHWSEAWQNPDHVHLIATIHADDPSLLHIADRQVSAVFHVLGRHDGRSMPDGKVMFGYKDSISQPDVRDDYTPVDDVAPKPQADHAPAKDDDQITPLDPLGTLFLDHDTRFQDIRFGLPSPAALGRNGSFSAFRVLSQDCAGFEAFLTRAATEILDTPFGQALLAEHGQAEAAAASADRGLAFLREVVAAQMCGRWRNGNPYDAPPDANIGARFNDFDYPAQSRCPVGSHVRRTNPRNGPVVQRISLRTRRITRRGMVYGPDFDPAHPDDQERGLLGNFICASLGAQFEAIMCDWLNLGLQHPDITGSNDPLIGANTPETSWFDLRLADGRTHRLRHLPRFVKTRGGAYTFLPTLSAIRLLARMTN